MAEYNIKSRRIAKFMTQRELALLSGIEQTLLDLIEQGLRQPNESQQKAIEDALANWSLDESL